MSFFQKIINFLKKFTKNHQLNKIKFSKKTLTYNTDITTLQNNTQIEPVKNVKKQERSIIVGIDFGTNSTKVIYQIAGIPSKNAFIFCFDEEIDGTPYCAIPSAVSIHEGKIYFGKEAVKLRQNQSFYFSSFKMCLGCFFEITACKKCHSIGLNKFRNGEVFLTDYSINLTAPSITVFYLAYIMNIIKQKLTEKYGKQYELEFYFNVSLPLNFLENKNNEFLNIIYKAEALSEVMVQGVDLQFLYEKYHQLSSKVDDLRKGNTSFVVEETRAAMHSIISAGYYETGKYGVIDIGASTTDISIFHYGGTDDIDKKFSYYADKCFLIGGDDFDIKLVQELNILGIDPSPQNIQLIRQAKEQLFKKKKFILKKYGINYDLNDIIKICNPLFKEIHSKFSETIRLHAFDKEREISRWKEINIIFIGGGSQWDYLKDQFKSSPFFGYNNDWNPNFLEINFPDNINLEESDVNPYKFKQNFLYFCVAHGLSYPIFDIYEAVYPGKVPPLQRIEIKVEKSDREELYPK